MVGRDAAYDTKTGHQHMFYHFELDTLTVNRVYRDRGCVATQNISNFVVVPHPGNRAGCGPGPPHCHVCAAVSRRPTTHTRNRTQARIPRALHTAAACALCTRRMSDVPVA